MRRCPTRRTGGRVNLRWPSWQYMTLYAMKSITPTLKAGVDGCEGLSHVLLHITQLCGEVRHRWRHLGRRGQCHKMSDSVEAIVAVVTATVEVVEPQSEFEFVIDRVLKGLRGFGEMTDREPELELNEAGMRLGDPPSSVDDLLGILDPLDFEAKVAKLTELGFGRDAFLELNYFGASSNDLRLNPDGSAVNPGAFQHQIRGDSNLMAQLLQSDPELAQVFLEMTSIDSGPCRRSAISERSNEASVKPLVVVKFHALMYAYPIDVEAQRKIEAAIRQKGIDENWATALEYNPEAFARVAMLYVDMEVNGVPLKYEASVYVDVMLHLSIVGHNQQLYLKAVLSVVGMLFSILYSLVYLVLDSPNMEILFGLDMLRKHRCVIDLQENVLRVGGGEDTIPFLQGVL
ncbi:hypothetical protein Syun_000774 [Stephania yunnanensis]|uniref:Uncharacterized protein n=1 Tax=Stephania yunnanensis TaxID=152371 RepID=A0AAP0LI53_9MAGN